MPVEKDKMVDIDTSGPGAEVELPEEKVKEPEQEVEVKDELEVDYIPFEEFQKTLE